MERLYVIVRSDLPPGAQLAQSCHALSAFACAHPDLHREWHTGGQNLVVLAIRDKFTLAGLLYDAANSGVEHARFHEPDFGNELTAIALGANARRLVASLPLALKTPKQAA